MILEQDSIYCLDTKSRPRSLYVLGKNIKVVDGVFHVTSAYERATARTGMTDKTLRNLVCEDEYPFDLVNIQREIMCGPYTVLVPREAVMLLTMSPSTRFPHQSAEEQCRKFAQDVLAEIGSYIKLYEKDLEEGAVRGFFRRFRAKRALKKLRREYARLQEVGVEKMGARVLAFIDVNFVLSDLEKGK